MAHLKTLVVVVLVIAAVGRLKPPLDGGTAEQTSPELSAVISANETAAVSALRKINTAEVTYLSVSGGNYGSMTALVSAGLLDPLMAGTVSGYSFSIAASNDDYTAMAIPASSATGRYGFFVTPDGVVRYANAEHLAPPGPNGKPVQVSEPSPSSPPSPQRAGDAQGDEKAAVANLRTINVAQVTYLSVSGGNYGSLAALISEGLLDPRFTGTISGYLFAIVTSGDEYTVTAMPASSTTGRYGFFSTPDGVVRYANSDTLAPPGQKGMPVR